MKVFTKPRFEPAFYTILCLEKLKQAEVCTYRDMPSVYTFDSESGIHDYIGIYFDDKLNHWCLLVADEIKYRWLYDNDWMGFYVGEGSITLVAQRAPVPNEVTEEQHHMTPRYAVNIEGMRAILEALSVQDYINVKIFNTVDDYRYLKDDEPIKKLQVVVRDALF
jgi:hypothetical protein